MISSDDLKSSGSSDTRAATPRAARGAVRYDIVARLWREHIGAYKSKLGLALTAAGFYALVTLSIPVLFKYIFDEIITKERDTTKYLAIMSIVFCALILRTIAQYFRTIFSAYVAFRTCTDLRNRLFKHLEYLNFSFFDKSRTGDLMSRITNDVITLQNVILNSLEDFFIAPVMVLGGLGILFYLNWILAVVVLGASLVVATLLKLFGGALRRVNDTIQKLIAEVTSVLSESIGTIRVVQSFGREEEKIKKFNDVSENALNELVKSWRYTAILLPSVEFIGFIAPFVIIFVIGLQMINGHSSFGDFLAVAGIGAIVSNPLNKLSRVFVTMHSGTSAADRIYHVLDTPIEIKDKPGAYELPEVDGLIVFESVSFEYNKDEEVLRSFSMTVEPGQTIALVGGSGSGKTTVVNLIPRFYEGSHGKITIDGHDIRDVTIKSLRAQIGIVAQDNILVHGTIRENIAFGRPDADDVDILDAARSAGAHQFIMEFPKGYNTIVGERGTTLSGGQRQRIAIARALLKDPRILILDEATASMDTITEAKIQDALYKLMYGRTTIVVAHRLTTIKKADKIIVMKNGRIVEQGTHDELMAAGGEYCELQSLYGDETAARARVPGVSLE